MRHLAGREPLAVVADDCEGKHSIVISYHYATTIPAEDRASPTSVAFFPRTHHAHEMKLRWFVAVAWLVSCSPQDAATAGPSTSSGSHANALDADVTAVTASGAAGDYSLSVTIASPDTGCNQYADWWEAISPDGNLLYRRILAHSHVDEQPFTRSGGPLSVQPDDEFLVRAHMSNGSYGGRVMRGSVSAGFVVATELAADFAAGLATAAPLPNGCAF